MKQKIPKYNNISELKDLYSKIRPEIIKRLKEFEILYKEGTDKEIFVEVAFCLLTPQSNAFYCWQAVENLSRNDVLFNSGYETIRDCLNKVRFKLKKAQYILEARQFLLNNGSFDIKNKIESLKNVFEIREWLVKNIKGWGYKESSHFLRNIGKGKDLAILDRHILKNLKFYGVINEIPESMTKKKYLDIEQKMTMFSNTICIPMDHLDMLFWYKQKGELFK